MRKLLIVLSIALACCGCASDRAKRLYRDAYDSYQRNELEKAESAISQIIYLDNKFVDAYILRSVINQANEKADLAVGDLLIALSIDKDNYLAHYDLGNLYFKQAKYREALEQFSLSLSARKDFANAYLNRANTYMKLREYKNALPDYRKFSALSQDQKDGVDRLIKVLERDTAS
jgi:tetratricopeptide (TPR) repeat protein